jgi:hypothetical protein
MALAALLAARRPPAPCAPAALPLRALVSHRSARCWIAAELVAYGAWTALLTFVGAFFVERLSLREPMVGWILAGGAAAYFAASTRRAAFGACCLAGSSSPRSRCSWPCSFVVQFGAAAPVGVAVGTFAAGAGRRRSNAYLERACARSAPGASAGMGLSAWLVIRVDDPREAASSRIALVPRG